MRLALTITLFLTSIAHANNNLFLPGDAFFPTILSKQSLEQLLDAPDKQHRFTYANWAYEGALCGYAGYGVAAAKLDRAVLDNLELAYDFMRQSEPRLLEESIEDSDIKLIEVNPIKLLIYAADFEFPKRALGLRYNENWVDEAVTFGHRRSHLRLCRLVEDLAAVELAWRDSSVVAAWPSQLPKVEPTSRGVRREPVILNGPFKIYLIGSESLTDIFKRKERYNTVLCVDSQGVTVFSCFERKWRSQALEEVQSDDGGDDLFGPPDN